MTNLQPIIPVLPPLSLEQYVEQSGLSLSTVKRALREGRIKDAVLRPQPNGRRKWEIPDGATIGAARTVAVPDPVTTGSPVPAPRLIDILEASPANLPIHEAAPLLGITRAAIIADAGTDDPVWHARKVQGKWIVPAWVIRRDAGL